MATNFHADLPNDQIHNPKDFDLARKNSILTKDSAGLLKWTPSTYLLDIDITFIDDVAGSLNNKYWLLYSSNNENVYRVIYRISGTLESESIDLGVVVPVFIAINDTASAIATATQFALQALSFQVGKTGNTLNITSVISANKPEFFSLQGVFPYTCTESPISNHVLKTDLNGKIVFDALPIINGTTGTLSVARGGTGVTTSTGSGDVVLSTSALLTTPIFEGAGVTFIGSHTGATKLVTTAIAGTNILTLPTTSGTLATVGGTETLTNKTLTAPNIGSGAIFNGSTSGSIKLQATALAGNNILTLPAETGTLATVGGTETLEGKTLTSPVITSPTGLVKGDVGLGNVDNTSNATERAAAATLTNKTLTTPIISSISNTGMLTLPTSTDTLVGRDTTDTLTNKNVRLTVETPATFPYELAAADAGKIIDLTASGSSIEVPISVFLPGDRITITNSYVGGNQTILAASGCTLYYNGVVYIGTSFNLPARKMLIFHCTVGGANPVFFSQS